jgi:hypothetical protein
MITFFAESDFASIGFTQSHFAKPGLPNPALRNCVCLIPLCVNRVYSLRLRENLVCRIPLCLNRVTRSDSAKPCLPNSALRKPGYSVRLRENLLCEIPICVNRVYLFQLCRRLEPAHLLYDVPPNYKTRKKTTLGS